MQNISEKELDIVLLVGENDFLGCKMTDISDIDIKRILNKLRNGEKLVRSEYIFLLSKTSEFQKSAIRKEAGSVTESVFGKRIFVRGLIEISNNCRNNCYYCGIRNSNRQLDRFRLSIDEILECCNKGDLLGFRTFVIQGGEDPRQDDKWITELVRQIRNSFPEHAITLSLGERSREAYIKFREAGADRYLLRHETANSTHYSTLHPPYMSFHNRINCLKTLKELGFQTGAGMMIGSPGQTVECLADDLILLDEIKPEMIGIGPFIPAANTPFAGEPAGNMETTLFLLSVLRLRFPYALLPATTALASCNDKGRVEGLKAGANVLMPNLSPEKTRKKYALYNNKLSSGHESAEQLEELKKELDKEGFYIDFSRGDYSGQYK